MEPPRIRIVREDSVVVVELTDEDLIEETMIQELGKSLFSLVEKSHPLRLVLDFAKVRRLSSIALGTFIRLSRRVGARGGSLRLCAMQKPVLKLFTATKLDLVFDILDDQETALRSLLT